MNLLALVTRALLWSLGPRAICSKRVWEQLTIA